MKNFKTLKRRKGNDSLATKRRKTDGNNKSITKTKVVTGTVFRKKAQKIK